MSISSITGNGNIEFSNSINCTDNLYVVMDNSLSFCTNSRNCANISSPHIIIFSASENYGCIKKACFLTDGSACPSINYGTVDSGVFNQSINCNTVKTGVFLSNSVNQAVVTEEACFTLCAENSGYVFSGDFSDASTKNFGCATFATIQCWCQNKGIIDVVEYYKQGYYSDGYWIGNTLRNSITGLYAVRQQDGPLEYFRIYSGSSHELATGAYPDNLISSDSLCGNLMSNTPLPVQLAMENLHFPACCGDLYFVYPSYFPYWQSRFGINDIFDCFSSSIRCDVNGCCWSGAVGSAAVFNPYEYVGSAQPVRCFYSNGIFKDGAYKEIAIDNFSSCYPYYIWDCQEIIPYASNAYRCDYYLSHKFFAYENGAVVRPADGIYTGNNICDQFTSPQSTDVYFFKNAKKLCPTASDGASNDFGLYNDIFNSICNTLAHRSEGGNYCFIADGVIINTGIVAGVNSSLLYCVYEVTSGCNNEFWRYCFSRLSGFYSRGAFCDGSLVQVICSEPFVALDDNKLYLYTLTSDFPDLDFDSMFPFSIQNSGSINCGLCPVAIDSSLQAFMYDGNPNNAYAANFNLDFNSKIFCGSNKVYYNNCLYCDIVACLYTPQILSCYTIGHVHDNSQETYYFLSDASGIVDNDKCGYTCAFVNGYDTSSHICVIDSPFYFLEYFKLCADETRRCCPEAIAGCIDYTILPNTSLTIRHKLVDGNGFLINSSTAKPGTYNKFYTFCNGAGIYSSGIYSNGAFCDGEQTCVDFTLPLIPQDSNDTYYWYSGMSTCLAHGAFSNGYFQNGCLSSSTCGIYQLDYEDGKYYNYYEGVAVGPASGSYTFGKFDNGDKLSLYGEIPFNPIDCSGLFYYQYAEGFNYIAIANGFFSNGAFACGNYNPIVNGVYEEILSGIYFVYCSGQSICAAKEGAYSDGYYLHNALLSLNNICDGPGCVYIGIVKDLDVECTMLYGVSGSGISASQAGYTFSNGFSLNTCASAQVYGACTYGYAECYIVQPLYLMGNYNCFNFNPYPGFNYGAQYFCARCVTYSCGCYCCDLFDEENNCCGFCCYTNCCMCDTYVCFTLNKHVFCFSSYYCEYDCIFNQYNNPTCTSSCCLVSSANDTEAQAIVNEFNKWNNEYLCGGRICFF